MIIDGILSIADGFFGWILQLFPVMKPNFTPESINSFTEILSIVNVIMPVKTMVILLGLMFGVYALQLAHGTVIWIISKIPFLSIR